MENFLKMRRFKSWRWCHCDQIYGNRKILFSEYGWCCKKLDLKWVKTGNFLLLLYPWLLILTQVMTGNGVAKVMDSGHPSFSKGDLVWGITRWEEYTLVTATESLFKIPDTDVPLSYYIGILGKLNMESLWSLWLLRLVYLTWYFIL